MTDGLLISIGFILCFVWGIYTGYFFSKIDQQLKEIKK